jgi:hypothetical protein
MFVKSGGFSGDTPIFHGDRHGRVQRDECQRIPGWVFCGKDNLEVSEDWEC